MILSIINAIVLLKRTVPIRGYALLLFVLLNSAAFSQISLPTDQEMAAVYELVKTPHKVGLVLEGDSAHHKVDCPTVFKRGKRWYMTYLVFDGRGYETWLAQSKDLVQWKKRGKLFGWADSTRWDGHQRAGYPSLIETAWGGSYRWKKASGKYWLSYFGGSTRGYEAGDLSVGMASSKKAPHKLGNWKSSDAPVLSAKDSNTGWWENKKIFKSSVIYAPGNATGYPYLMFYNANGDSAINQLSTRWYERIGMAASENMHSWHRLFSQPLVHHPMGITGDGVIQKIDSLWVMFYFGAFWKGRKDAFNRFACSYDLIHWRDWNGEDLIQSSEPYDARFAHKSYVLQHKGIVFHFYCAVDAKDHRAIALATSQPVKKEKDKGRNKKLVR